MVKEALIIGIDPGKNFGIAILNHRGEIVKKNTFVNVKHEKIVDEIQKLGFPIIIASDKEKLPKFVGEFAKIFRTEVYVPKKDLLRKNKLMISRLFKDEKFNNDHERDAFSAAYLAWKKEKKRIEKIERFWRENIKDISLERFIVACYQNKNLNFSQVKELLEATTKEDSEIKNLLKIVESLNEENKALRKKIESLRREKFDVKAGVKKSIQKKLLELVRENSLLREKVKAYKEKAEEVEKIVNMFIDEKIGRKNIIVMPINKEERNLEYVFVDDQGFIEEIKGKKIYVVKEKDLINKLKKKGLKVIHLDEIRSKKLIKHNNYIIIEEQDLGRPLSKEEVIKLIEEYKRNKIN